MRGALGRRASGTVSLLALALALIGPPTASAQDDPDRYSLVHGCYALHSESAGAFVAQAGSNYTATAAAVAGAEPFRMQATDLGKYLLYGADRDFLSISQLDPIPVVGGVISEAQPSGRADWTVDEQGDAFTLVNESQSKQLSVDAQDRVVPVAEGSAGDSGLFTFVAREGCPEYPEVDTNVSGDPVTGDTPYGEVTGLLEGHLHHMAFEFLGGKAHCGRPWHRFGAPFALRDCPDHEVGNGCAAVLENVLYGEPARCHDPVGWPTFADWPDPKSLTHEQTYYKWLERAHRGGLRVFVNLLVENRALCEVYPLKQNSCNEMDSVLLQQKRAYQLQDYIDAQSGGPGEGWYRIVRNPFEARRVINQGKLAVVLGMETSEPFNCRVVIAPGAEDIPACTEEDIRSWVERLHDLGIRQMEVTNKFDNALTGVAGDNGTTGTLVNGANFLSTGSFWDLEHCDDPVNHDHAPASLPNPVPHNDDQIIANGIEEFAPAIPAYEEPPLCNQRGLTVLGEYAIRRIMDKQIIFDPDHMSVKARDQAMSLVESEDYPGLISSHSWSTENTLPRIYRLGGVVTPYAGSSESFVHQWEHLESFYSGRQYFGVGYGADMNGFGSQGLPRGADVPNPVTYPFQSWDGEVTIDQQQSGERSFDINTDGVAHYGLYPDWIEDLRQIAGDDIVEDMGRGAEAYLQMWERANGIDKVRCGGWRNRDFDAAGLGGRVALGDEAREALERGGQPERRTQAWRWCASADKESKRVHGVFSDAGEIDLVASTVGANEAAGIGTGDPASKLRSRADRLGDGLWSKRAGPGSRYVFGTDGGEVTFAGVATAGAASSAEALRSQLDLAGL
jgi:hypothetical protein